VLSVTQNVDKEGNLHVQVKTARDNRFSGLPGVPAGQIQINVNAIQAVPPTCNCPKPEDEKKREPND